jgi:hypothetical protein
LIDIQQLTVQFPEFPSSHETIGLKPPNLRTGSQPKCDAKHNKFNKMSIIHARSENVRCWKIKWHFRSIEAYDVIRLKISQIMKLEEEFEEIKPKPGKTATLLFV